MNDNEDRFDALCEVLDALLQDHAGNEVTLTIERIYSTVTHKHSISIEVIDSFSNELIVDAHAMGSDIDAALENLIDNAREYLDELQ